MLHGPFSFNMQRNTADIAIGATVGIVLGSVSWLLTAHLIGGALDEGIYLEGGRRIASGEVLYRDLFTFIGPICFWIQALLHSLFGAELFWQRLSTAIAVAGISWGGVSVGQYLGERWNAVLAASVWVGMMLQVPNRFEVNHRWESIAFLSIAVAVLLAQSVPGRVASAGAGILMGLAVATTASFAVPAIVLGLTILLARRQSTAWYAAGLVSLLGLVFLVLWWQGVLGNVWDAAQWLRQNYAQANRFGYARFPARVPPEFWFYVYLGAVTLPLAVVLGLSHYWKTREWQMLLMGAVSLSLLVSLYPKWDAHSLVFVSPFGWAVVVGLMQRYSGSLAISLVRPALLVLIAYFGFSAAMGNSAIVNTSSRVGQIQMVAGNANALFKMEGLIPARSTLFVYPYLPWIYTLLDAHNPTRYSFLQPGMMTAADEDKVLEDLNRRPPEFLFWQEFTDDRVKLIWPSSNPDRHRFIRLETWFLDHYEESEAIEGGNFRGRIWRRK